MEVLVKVSLKIKVMVILYNKKIPNLFCLKTYVILDDSGKKKRGGGRNPKIKYSSEKEWELLGAKNQLPECGYLMSFNPFSSSS